MTFKSFMLGLAVCALTATPSWAQIADIGDAETLSKDIERGEPENTADADPWEGFNRAMFTVNDTLDTAFFVPAAKTYRAVTHKKQRKGIRNLLANARMPVVLVNDLLQGEFKRAGHTVSRFAINTTIGFGGMGDPAERMGIPEHSEDFGQTLAVWGIPSGPYLVLPFFGPSTLRDGVGAAADSAIDPVFWVRTDAAQYTRYARTGITTLSVREPLIEPLKDIRMNSLDYYASIRSFYLQSRKREIANGRTNFEDLPDIGDFEEFDDLE